MHNYRHEGESMTATGANHGFLHIERRGPVLVATLNRPGKLNALRREDHQQLARLLRTVATDDETRVLVLRGEGRAFCAGGDYTLVEQGLQSTAGRLANLEDGRELVHAHLDLDKPVVAAIQGQTSGAGAILALLSDIVLAEPSTRLCDGHVALGLAAGDGGVLTWPRAMGLLRAKRYLLTGDYIAPDEAERLGLITEVVPENMSTRRAFEWADRLAALNPAALTLTKRLLNALVLRDIDLLESGLAYEMLTLGQPEVADALAAAVARVKD
jgi:enoyl-CoA hydratase